jgi:hypothetical protein
LCCADHETRLKRKGEEKVGRVIRGKEGFYFSKKKKKIAPNDTKFKFRVVFASEMTLNG